MDLTEDELVRRWDREQELHEEVSGANPGGSAQDQHGNANVQDLNSALKQASQKRQKTGGANQGPLWRAFNRSNDKKNASHYWAICRACCDAGESLVLLVDDSMLAMFLYFTLLVLTQVWWQERIQRTAVITGSAANGKVSGTKGAMQHHIKICPNLTEAQKKQALSVDGAQSHTGSSQADLSKFMSAKDVPFRETEQAKLDQLALQATITANLPRQWLQIEYVVELFQFIRPKIQLPDRKKLSGQLLLSADQT